MANHHVLFVLLALVGVAVVVKFGKFHEEPSVPLAPAVELDSRVTLLDNQFFSVLYRKDLKAPICVRYVLPPGEPLILPRAGNVSAVRDARLPVETLPTSGDGLALSPLVTPGLMEATFGTSAMARCYLSSGMTLRSSGNGAALWNLLSSAEARFVSPEGPVEVAAGPVFDRHPPYTADGVAIPMAHFKIIHARGRTFAFIIPQDAQGTSLDDYKVSPERVSEVTGIAF